MQSKTLLIICLVGLVVIQVESASSRQKRGVLTDEAERILAQAGAVDVNNVSQMIDLIERNRAADCLARVICELSHNTGSHGDTGVRFARSLLRFRQNTSPKVRYYTDAMKAGAMVKSQEQCRSRYPKCSHSTTEVISVGNKLLRLR